MAMEDVSHLWKKGALTIPDTPFRDALLQSYVEFVHPYMPLMELDEFLRIVYDGAEVESRISLLLFLRQSCSRAWHLWICHISLRQDTRQERQHGRRSISRLG